MVKNRRAMQEMWQEPRVQSLRWKGPVGKKKWQPTPVSLGNPMDRGAWRATVHGVAKGQTRLKD